VLSGAPNCTSQYVVGGQDQLTERTDTQIGPAIGTALATIRQRAPQARVVLVDYPALSPDPAHTPAGGCWANPLQQPDSLPLTTVDLPYLYRVQAHLDAVLAQRAAAAHVALARVFPASLAHTACSADPWTNGVELTGLSLAPGSLHPNPAGATQLAAAVERVVRAGAPPDRASSAAGASAASSAPSSVAPSAVAVTSSTSAAVPVWVWIGLAALVAIVVLSGLLWDRSRRSRSG
jgi:hypothetical protein